MRDDALACNLPALYARRLMRDCLCVPLAPSHFPFNKHPTSLLTRRTSFLYPIGVSARGGAR